MHRGTPQWDSIQATLITGFLMTEHFNWYGLLSFPDFTHQYVGHSEPTTPHHARTTRATLTTKHGRIREACLYQSGSLGICIGQRWMLCHDKGMMRTVDNKMMRRKHHGSVWDFHHNWWLSLGLFECLWPTSSPIGQSRSFDLRYEQD